MGITYIEEEWEPKGLQWRRLQLRANKCSRESREVNEESNTSRSLNVRWENVETGPKNSEHRGRDAFGEDVGEL
jgi:hypothetical protein